MSLQHSQPSPQDHDMSNNKLYDDPEEEQKDHIAEVSPNEKFFRFNEELGFGAYKTVYKGYDNDSGCEVAWNVIKLQGQSSVEKNRISEEIALLKKINHKNIMNFITAWINKSKNEVVFITECLSGGSLKKYIRRIKKPRLKVLKIWCQQILSGLQYLHELKPHPIIHRDIKCENIFVNTMNNEIKIGDLGLALTLNKDYTTSVLGTPEFMAPEIYDEKYGTSVDIYAFGMCLIEMATIQTPYKECTAAPQVYKKVMQGIYPNCFYLISNQSLKSFILKCISNKNERPTASQLLLDDFFKENEFDNNPIEIHDYSTQQMLITLHSGQSSPQTQNNPPQISYSKQQSVEQETIQATPTTQQYQKDQNEEILKTMEQKQDSMSKSSRNNSDQKSEQHKEKGKDNNQVDPCSSQFSENNIKGPVSDQHSNCPQQFESQQQFQQPVSLIESDTHEETKSNQLINMNNIENDSKENNIESEQQVNYQQEQCANNLPKSQFINERSQDPSQRQQNVEEEEVQIYEGNEGNEIAPYLLEVISLQELKNQKCSIQFSFKSKTRSEQFCIDNIQEDFSEESIFQFAQNKAAEMDISQYINIFEFDLYNLVCEVYNNFHKRVQEQKQQQELNAAHEIEKQRSSNNSPTIQVNETNIIEIFNKNYLNYLEEVQEYLAIETDFNLKVRQSKEQIQLNRFHLNQQENQIDYQSKQQHQQQQSQLQQIQFRGQQPVQINQMMEQQPTIRQNELLYDFLQKKMNKHIPIGQQPQLTQQPISNQSNNSSQQQQQQHTGQLKDILHLDPASLNSSIGPLIQSNQTPENQFSTSSSSFSANSLFSQMPNQQQQMIVSLSSQPFPSQPNLQLREQQINSSPIFLQQQQQLQPLYQFVSDNQQLEAIRSTQEEQDIAQQQQQQQQQQLQLYQQQQQQQQEQQQKQQEQQLKTLQQQQNAQSSQQDFQQQKQLEQSVQSDKKLTLDNQSSPVFLYSTPLHSEQHQQQQQLQQQQIDQDRNINLNLNNQSLKEIKFTDQFSFLPLDALPSSQIRSCTKQVVENEELFFSFAPLPRHSYSLENLAQHPQNISPNSHIDLLEEYPANQKIEGSLTQNIQFIQNSLNSSQLPSNNNDHLPPLILQQNCSHKSEPNGQTSSNQTPSSIQQQQQYPSQYPTASISNQSLLKPQQHQQQITKFEQQNSTGSPALNQNGQQPFLVNGQVKQIDKEIPSTPQQTQQSNGIQSQISSIPYSFMSSPLNAYTQKPSSNQFLEDLKKLLGDVKIRVGRGGQFKIERLSNEKKRDEEDVRLLQKSLKVLLPQQQILENGHFGVIDIDIWKSIQQQLELNMAAIQKKQDMLLAKDLTKKLLIKEQQSQQSKETLSNFENKLYNNFNLNEDHNV